MQKEYKIEVKPNIYHVMLARGEYPDYEEKHLFFSGTNEKQVWEFLKRYVNDIDIESTYATTSNIHILKYIEDIHVSEKFVGKKEDTEYAFMWTGYGWNVSITPHKIIYFKK